MESDNTSSSNTTASISSWSWRHRFYAFLLRRALGPLLSTKSKNQLQQSISNVDWSTGELQLVNVELDPTYLTNIIQGNCASDDQDTNDSEQKNNIAVHYACIQQFSVHISVCDIESTTTSSSSTARKATSVFLQSMFGSNDTNSDDSVSMALKVHVVLKGIDIILAPKQSDTKMEWSTTYKQQPLANTCSDNINEQSDTAQQQPGFFTSLVDSAMKSLRLSIDVSDLKVSVYSKYHNNNAADGISVNYENGEATCVTLSIASARYYDLIESKQVSSDNRRLDVDNKKSIDDEPSTREKIVISKAFDWECILIQTSSTSSIQEKATSTLANTPCLQSSGMGKLRFRIYEKWSSNNTFISARQGIEVLLGEQLSIEVDVSSLTHMIDIVNAITTPLGDDYGDFVDAYEDDMDSKTFNESSTILKEEGRDHPDQHLLTDEFSRETYDAIMKQYTEARHLARTQELRGGLLIPSFNGENGDTPNDTDDISFDAFFDANDHSLSYYNSMLDENSMQHSDEDSKLNGEKKHNRSIKQTKLEVGLSEFTVKVNVGTSSSIEDEEHHFEYILLSMGDLRVLAFRSNEESKLNCSLSHFDVESQVFDCQQQTIVNAPLLRFLDESEGGLGNGLLLSSPPCVSLMAEFMDRNDEDRNSSVRLDITLQPLEITYQDTAFHRLSDVIAELPQLEAPMSSKEEEDDKAATLRDVHLAVSCSSAVLLLPCQQVPKILFQRHGYKDQASGGNTFVGIGVEVDNITLDVSHKSHHDGDDGTTSDESTTMTCTKSILFVKGIELEQVRRHNRKTITSQRADLVALVGDVDSETPISISFSKLPKSNSQQKSVFPIILPLSSLKARQYEDESDDDIDTVEATPSGMKTSDPQFILSSEANEAESELVVNLPNIFLDFTACEKQELSNLLSSLTSVNKESSDDDLGNETKGNTVGIGVNVGQLSVVLHPAQPYEPNESSSYSIIMDRIQIHALFRNSGLRNIRVLSHDVTLYELSNFCQQLKGTDCPISCSERCKKIQARLTKTSSTLARSFVFRQKLCKPMTLDTPSFQLDILIRGDDNCAESSFYMNVYDMSYRYNINSEWMQNLSTLIKGVDKPETDSNTEQPASLMNLFITITDCQMDYTPPITLRTASRVIVRLGELRFSSNIVTPAATIQAYKLALADMNVHICNYRHSYNEENALLSCAHRLLNDDDIFIPEKVKCLKSVVGIDDALCRMGFVNIVGLDTLDAIIFKSNANGRNDCRKKNDPSVSITLTLGRLAMNACHDSFSCLNSTYNEWFIKSTALSEEELNELKELPDAQSELKTIAPPTKQSSEVITTEVANQSMNTKASTSSIENQDRDDKVSLDLTKSLLFQNYYTFDAKTNRHATIQVQESEDIIKQSEDDMSASSEDEWNTIEHDFIQHSTIPREQDHAAEWIVCDEPPANVPTSDVFQSTLSQTVKVYPQHIPVKPVLDPFNGGNKVDTAKLAGTSDAPEVGLRLIVKDGSIHFRFFDGFDWIADAPTFHQKKPKPKDRKEALLSSLIGGGDDSESRSDTRLDIAPLPEDRNRNLQRDIVRRRLKRNPNKYFQLSFDGVKLKNDSFAQSKHHLLASRLDLSVTDFMVVETISSSSGDHVKMMGEWFNESIHPRDDSDGIIMLQMTTKHPRQRVSSDGKLMSDESRATLELLPLRCYFNQNALRFVRNFFSGNHHVKSEEEDDAQDSSDDTQIEDDEIVQIFFESFSVRPVRLKVDYQPENMDVDSFKEGNYIELLNICPLEEMVLNLQPVQMNDLTGWGSVFGELASKWIEDICNTQSHKFFTRASPFQPFSNLSDPLLDLAMVLVVPEGSTSAYLKSIIGGTTHLASKVILEALSTSAKLTKFAAKAIPSKVKGSLPRRPKTVPRHAGDSMSHAYESMTSGLREANYKIVTIPLKEYQRSGASGAATAAVKGIPIGIIAPLAGASEALSYTLLGLRNQLQPDVRREEEASLRGLPS